MHDFSFPSATVKETGCHFPQSYHAQDYFGKQFVLWTVRSEQTGLGISASLAFITGTKKKKKKCARGVLVGVGEVLQQPFLVKWWDSQH